MGPPTTPNSATPWQATILLFKYRHKYNTKNHNDKQIQHKYKTNTKTPYLTAPTARPLTQIKPT